LITTVVVNEKRDVFICVYNLAFGLLTAKCCAGVTHVERSKECDDTCTFFSHKAEASLLKMRA